MKELQKGQFFGNHYQKSLFEDCIITDTEYTHEKVDWHFHENPYFTYLLSGKLYEENKKEAYYLKPGNILFHNWQDAHHNKKPTEFTRGFHIELQKKWFEKHQISQQKIEGSGFLENPVIISLMNKIFLETKIEDGFSQLSIDSLLLEIFYRMENPVLLRMEKNPKWILKLKEVLLEENLNFTLEEIATKIEIHPVHLSREFSRYFGVSFGQYVRYLKLNKAILLMHTNQFTMTEMMEEQMLLVEQVMQY